MIFDYRKGEAAQRLMELTEQAIRSSSAYTMPALGEVQFQQVHQDGERFMYSKEEDNFLMFAYLPKYNTRKYKSLPRFHPFLCKVREEYSGYVFSPKMPVNIWCKDDNRSLEGENLSMCKQCQSKATRSLFGARGELPWYEYVIREASQERPIKSDGYIDLWRQVSEAVREKASWTCQQCKIKLPLPVKGFYLEVHHRDHNKKNNSESNLVALCVACHAFQDEVHRKNYSTGPNSLKLKGFTELRAAWSSGPV